MIARISALAIAALLVVSSSGILTVSAVVTGVPSQATGLAVTVIPPRLPADGKGYQAVVVSLVDSAGLPSAAMSPISVFLTSSQTNIVAVPDTLTIPVGAEYVIASATTTTTPGTASITASSHGLTSASATLTTATPSGFPAQLKVFASPSSLLSRRDSGVVRVELVDDAGFPSKAINAVPVLLSSSNVTIAGLGQTTLTILPGDIYATGSFNSSANPGQALITASSTGFRSGGAVITVVSPFACAGSCGAAELLLKLLPGNLPTGGSQYNVLEVGLATSTGLPAISSSNTIVTLVSDTPDVVSLPNPTVIIPAGQISVLEPLQTSALEGKGTITATSANLTPGTADVQTTIPAPSKLQAYIAPPSLFATSGANQPILVVQLQDSSGNPARARQPTEIHVTSSNGSMVQGPITLNIATGNDLSFTLLTVKGAGQSALTASAQDLDSSGVNLQLVRSPLVVSLIASLPRGFLYTNETLPLSLTMSFLGRSVNGASISWLSVRGTVAPELGVTNSAGQASTLFAPTATGTGNITAFVNSPLTGPVKATYLVNIFQAPIKPPPTWLDLLKSYWYFIAAAVAAVGVALFYLFRMRRKKQREEIEAGFEVV